MGRVVAAQAGLGCVQSWHGGQNTNSWLCAWSQCERECGRTQRSAGQDGSISHRVHIDWQDLYSPRLRSRTIVQKERNSGVLYPTRALAMVIAGVLSRRETRSGRPLVASRFGARPAGRPTPRCHYDSHILLAWGQHPSAAIRSCGLESGRRAASAGWSVCSKH